MGIIFQVHFHRKLVIKRLEENKFKIVTYKVQYILNDFFRKKNNEYNFQIFLQELDTFK